MLKHENTLLEIESNKNTFSINGDEKNIKIEKIDENKFRIKSDKSELIAYGKKVKDKYFINIEGRQYIFTEVEDEFASEIQNEDRAEITTPMPGNVVKIIAKLNEEVEDGDPLLVIEAMKMETTLYSPIKGIVKEINVAEKEQVDPEKYMMLIEKE